MSVWDNQQATKFGWFIGILDGEGCFHKNNYCSRWVRIYNTDLDIIKECEDSLNNSKLVFRTEINYRENRKPICVINIKDVNARILYSILEPYLECRRNEFQSLLGASQSIRDPSVDLNWLVGIWEAEGHISFGSDDKGYGRPYIGINNTNSLIISKTTKCLRDIKVAHNYYKHKLKREDYKYQEDIQIRSLYDCRRFLYIMDGHWISRRNIERSKLMREYINLRLQMNRLELPTSRQLSIVQAMRDLNR